MKKILFLSSAFIMTTLGAYAADGIITGGAGTCTVDVLGVSDDGAKANTIAVWITNQYELQPGEYLSVTETSVEPAPCPAGSYCVGGSGFTIDNADSSVTPCPTEYPNSRAGAGAQNQCYTACTVANANLAHATAVSGNDYFGDGVDTCEPTACDTGWHVQAGFNLTNTIGTTAGTGRIDNDNDGNQRSSYNLTASDAGIAGDPKAFAVAYGDKGMITGHGRCSTQEGVFDYIFDTNTTKEVTVVDSLPDTIGQYCYCQLDGYKSASGEIMKIPSAPWVFYRDLGSVDGCTPSCSEFCAYSLFEDGEFFLNFRAAVFNAVGSIGSVATCVANTINIDWNPDNGGEHEQNTCEYGDAIILPETPTKPGYTFGGWKLVESTTTTE